MKEKIWLWANRWLPVLCYGTERKHLGLNQESSLDFWPLAHSSSSRQPKLKLWILSALSAQRPSLHLLKRLESYGMSSCLSVFVTLVSPELHFIFYKADGKVLNGWGFGQHCWMLSHRSFKMGSTDINPELQSALFCSPPPFERQKQIWLFRADVPHGWFMLFYKKQTQKCSWKGYRLKRPKMSSKVLKCSVDLNGSSAVPS